MAKAAVPVTENTNSDRFKTATQETYRYCDIYLNISDVHNDSFFM